ncbi:MAG: hypothetical protein KF819_00070 [Labilithrix sp.]|nr:hypothetical protein [Labilithrix sp.]
MNLAILEPPPPPPPHDPRERDLALTLEGWEVRVFGDRQFEYFATRGFWHVQLWHPRAGVSILTPSRLTRGFYEAFPVAGWKGQAPDYEHLATLVREHRVALPSKAALLRIERAFVDDVVHARDPMFS